MRIQPMPNESGQNDGQSSPKQAGIGFSLTALLLVVAAGLFPWQGRLGLLKTLIPFLIVLFVQRSRRRTLAEVGLPWPVNPIGMLFWALVLTAAAHAFEFFLLKPFYELLALSAKDVTLFEPMRGNLGMFLMYLFFMWIFAALGEEFIWRGFLFTELAAVLGSSRMAWCAALFLSSVIFGLLHLYQGPRGVLSATVTGLIGGVIFLCDGKRLWLPILVHGLGNTFSFFLIYLGLY